MGKSLLMTTSSAARLLGVSAECVRAYERSGRLPAIRTENGFRLFQRADLERLAKQRRRQQAVVIKARTPGASAEGMVRRQGADS